MSSKSTRFKIFVDGSTDLVNAGYGIYIESNGKCMFEAVGGHWSSSEIESIAICKAMEYVMDNDLTHVLIITDCKGCLNDPVYNDICQEKDILISWMPREKNRKADHLATMGRKKAYNQFINTRMLFSCQVSERYEFFLSLQLTPTELVYLNNLYGFSNEKIESFKISNNIKFIHSMIGKQGRKSLPGYSTHWINGVQKLTPEKIDLICARFFRRNII